MPRMNSLLFYFPFRIKEESSLWYYRFYGEGKTDFLFWPGIHLKQIQNWHQWRTMPFALLNFLLYLDCHSQPSSKRRAPCLTKCQFHHELFLSCAAKAVGLLRRNDLSREHGRAVPRQHGDKTSWNPEDGTGSRFVPHNSLGLYEYGQTMECDIFVDCHLHIKTGRLSFREGT